jgi:tRNA pseudouridine55 synthase
VRKVRATIKRYLDTKKIKVGHAGTLDPLATGLLIICTGKKTKTIEKFQSFEKEYIAGLQLGATTPSYDKETKIDKEYPYEHITKELIEEVLAGFIGVQEQIPPVFSAKRVNGQRAYKNARKGIDIEIKPSIIEIKKIEILKFDLPELVIRVECGKGTYIRALARDIGKRLNSGAYLTSLRRTRIGSFSVEDALSVIDFKEQLDIKEKVQYEKNNIV